jgi:hypothetical protein
MRLSFLFSLFLSTTALLPAQYALSTILAQDQTTGGSASTTNVHPNTLEADLNGVWVGLLLQNPGGIAREFEFSMQLNHNGIFLNGTSFVRFGDIWAEMELSGYQQQNGSWKLTETKILRGKKPEDLSWCLKRYELRVSYTADGIVIHGPWWGSSGFGPCIPGSVRLVRKKKTA